MPTSIPDLSRFTEVPLARTQEEIQLIGADKPNAISVALAYTTILSSPRRRPGLQPVSAVGIAWEDRSQQIHCRVFTLQHLSDLGKFTPLFVQSDSESTNSEDSIIPYAIFSEGHETIAQLMRAGIEPGRFGCLDVAAQLLYEGRDSRDGCGPNPMNFSLPRIIDQEFQQVLEDQGVQAGSHRAAAQRALCQIALMRTYTPHLRKLRLGRIFELECQLLPAVIEMESNGIVLDALEFERIAGSWIHEANREDRTPSQVARFRKLLSTYRWWARDYLDIDGRIRCQLRPMASESGRFSCFEPNLQQVPSEHTAPGLRACFKASPGYQLIVADYAQIELRVAAHLAPCPAMRKVFEQNADLHQTTAAAITGQPLGQIDRHQRQLAKAVNFGFLFGMGAKKFRDYAKKSFGVELSLEQAQHARTSFMNRYPGIKAWHRRIAKTGNLLGPQGHTVVTALGRRKHFSSQSFRFSSALNIPIQGTAAEGLKLAMIRLRPLLKKIGGRALLCIHDEYIAEVPLAVAKTARDQIQEMMEQSMAEIVPSVPIVVQANVAQNWGEKSADSPP